MQTAGDCTAARGPRDATGAATLGWGRDFGAEFNLLEPLGRGSFGAVHVAVHRRTSAAFAVKVVDKRRAGACRLHAIQQEVRYWALAMGSSYVARLDALYEVRARGAALRFRACA